MTAGEFGALILLSVLTEEIDRLGSASAPSIRCGAGAIRAAFARLRGVGLGKAAIRGMTPDDEIRPRALALEHFDVDGGCLARRLGSGFGWRDSSICMHWGLRHFQRSRPSRPALSACHALVLRWGVFRRPDVELRSHLRPLARSKIQAIRPTPIATGRRKGGSSSVSVRRAAANAISQR